MSVYSRPTVSVVVPCYNNAAFITDTIESILAQSFADFELIISDHTSVDGTWEIVQSFRSDPRVRLLRLPRTSAPEGNWTHVTSAARGDLLKLVCGDDLLAPNCLEVQVQAMRAHPAAVLVAARRDIITAKGDVLLRARGLPGMIGQFAGTEAVRRAVASGTNPFGEPACVLLRKSVLDAVGGWDGTFSYVLDQHTYSKVLMHGEFIGIPDVLASFRLSEGQWSHALARRQCSQVIDFHKELARNYPRLLSAVDLGRGRAKATALAFARRLAYLSLAREMRAPVINAPSGGQALPTAGAVAK